MVSGADEETRGRIGCDEIENVQVCGGVTRMDKNRGEAHAGQLKAHVKAK